MAEYGRDPTDQQRSWLGNKIRTDTAMNGIRRNARVLLTSGPSPALGTRTNPFASSPSHAEVTFMMSAIVDVIQKLTVTVFLPGPIASHLPTQGPGNVGQVPSRDLPCKCCHRDWRGRGVCALRLKDPPDG